MKKIPTLFKRDPATNLRHVMAEVNPGCEWVLAGEGVPTRKYDGTCCLVRAGKLYKRHEVKPGKEAPPGFEQADFDEVTGKAVGWVPVGAGPEDRWHSEAFHGDEVDGTYELVGPKVQGNPEKFSTHTLMSHAHAERLTSGGPGPRTFDDLRTLLTNSSFDFEGIVWHHPDGRMAKLKRRDFPKEEASNGG